MLRMNELKNIFRKFSDISNLKSAFVASIPVMTGYCSVGFAFGLLVVSWGYPWFLALIMPVFIYAGAAQFLALSFFLNNTGYIDIIITIFLLNARHMVYGISMLNKYKNTSYFKPYLIFSLTDETYAILTLAKIPETINKKRFYFYVSLLDQLYWITGCICGALFGKIVTFNTNGLDFALTALFVVILIEQYKSSVSRIPFAIALVCSVIAFFLSKQYMLLISIFMSIAVLFFARRLITDNEPG
jgi:4-azaleucine resistance transporter AzlC